jgi:hypothetical protein
MRGSRFATTRGVKALEIRARSFVWRGGVEEDEPLPRVALARRVRQVGAEGVMLHQHPVDALEVEDHPQIESRQVEYGRAAPHLVVRGVGAAAHLVGEKVYHCLCPPPPNGRASAAAIHHHTSCPRLQAVLGRAVAHVRKPQGTIGCRMIGRKSMRAINDARRPTHWLHYSLVEDGRRDTSLRRNKYMKATSANKLIVSTFAAWPDHVQRAKKPRMLASKPR